MTQEEINSTVTAIIKGEQTQLHAIDMDAMLNADTTLREAIRLTFQDLGVEVEFSGKGLHERGVVIDMDTEQLQQQGLDPEVLRFGQTVVRVKQD